MSSIFEDSGETKGMHLPLSTNSGRQEKLLSHIALDFDQAKANGRSKQGWRKRGKVRVAEKKRR